MESSIVLSTRFHVAAYRDNESKSFDGKATKNKTRPRAWSGKKHNRGDGEKESGWQHQQSSVFHGLSFSLLVGPGYKYLAEGRPALRLHFLVPKKRDPQCGMVWC